MKITEVMNSLRINCPSLMDHIRKYEADKGKMEALEHKLANRNLAITMSKERAERIAKEDAGHNGSVHFREFSMGGRFRVPRESPPPTLEPQQPAVTVLVHRTMPADDRIRTSPMKRLPPPECRKNSFEINYSLSEDRPRKQLTLKRMSSTSSIDTDGEL